MTESKYVGSDTDSVPSSGSASTPESSLRIGGSSGESQSGLPRPPVAWELDSMTMEAFSARREAGDPNAPGTVAISHGVSSHYDDDGDVLIYLIKTTTTFSDNDGEVVATIESTFGLAYDVGDGEPRDEDVAAFRSSVILHVTPFVREFLATATNRLGLAPFSLPLSRNPEVDDALH